MTRFSMAPAWQVGQWFNTQRPLDLDALRGKVVLLHAFQMLCPGCVSHGVPQAERVHRLFADDGVVVIGLHTVFEHHAAMTPVALEAFLHEYGVTHPVGVDMPVEGDRIPATMREYALEGTPSLMLIDKEGRLRLKHFGRVDDLRLARELMRLVAEQAPAAVDESVEAANSSREQSCTDEGCAITT